MDLQDLFVTYKQVIPVSFTPTTPELPNSIYVNLKRAQQAAQNYNNTVDNTVDNEEIDDMSTWKVTSPIPKKQEVTHVEGKKLQEYRNNSEYKEFKTELDTFIKNNPEYSDIKNELDYLAALESRYRKNVENYQGSKALGWFQFMDSTRAAYNNQSRKDFAEDAQSQLLTAAKHYKYLQKTIKDKGGNPNDFVTMYGAWWRPASAYNYITNPNHNYTSKYYEDFLTIRNRAAELFQ